MIPTLKFIGVAIVFEHFSFLISSRDSESADHEMTFIAKMGSSCIQ